MYKLLDNVNFYSAEEIEQRFSNESAIAEKERALAAEKVLQEILIKNRHVLKLLRLLRKSVQLLQRQSSLRTLLLRLHVLRQLKMPLVDVLTHILLLYLMNRSVQKRQKQNLRKKLTKSLHYVRQVIQQYRIILKLSRSVLKLLKLKSLEKLQLRLHAQLLLSSSYRQTLIRKFYVHRQLSMK